ncbi:MAG: tetratricopeptide repeat protein [Methanomassiliicoccales archaeon]|nr:MAG: tetratricopeptide repeat protein [Methanomassiliicoccales archaeon]
MRLFKRKKNSEEHETETCEPQPDGESEIEPPLDGQEPVGEKMKENESNQEGPTSPSNEPQKDVTPGEVVKLKVKKKRITRRVKRKTSQERYDPIDGGLGGDQSNIDNVIALIDVQTKKISSNEATKSRLIKRKKRKVKRKPHQIEQEPVEENQYANDPDFDENDVHVNKQKENANRNEDKPDGLPAQKIEEPSSDKFLRVRNDTIEDDSEIIASDIDDLYVVLDEPQEGITSNKEKNANSQYPLDKGGIPEGPPQAEDEPWEGALGVYESDYNAILALAGEEEDDAMMEDSSGQETSAHEPEIANDRIGSSNDKKTICGCIDVHLKEGRKHLKNKQFPQALKCFNRALELNSRNWDAWSGMGDVLMEMGKIEQASICYKKAMASSLNMGEDFVQNDDSDGMSQENEWSKSLMTYISDEKLEIKVNELEKSDENYELFDTPQQQSSEEEHKIEEDVQIQENAQGFSRLGGNLTFDCPVCGSTMDLKKQMCPKCSTSFHEEEFRNVHTGMDDNLMFFHRLKDAMAEKERIFIHFDGENGFIRFMEKRKNSTEDKFDYVFVRGEIEKLCYDYSSGGGVP